ncbi:putative uncharacterized protein [Firmicutes bacterium CAG:822]|nr:putative uncharacterized protein [Firmicutes bacterium CAG:822]
MMLFKLSIKNIARSIKDYAIYFFTLILGVAIFYIFNAIESQTVMMNVSSSTYEIIDLMNSMLSGVSVFVAFILGFLIIYANRFLMKRRNKEFGIYLTLGMSKRKVSLILFFETLIVGCISLVIGLVLGTALSQVMSLLVANMFEAKMTEFEFVFSTSACIKTLIYFSVMYVLVMIFNTYNVSRCRLIDLLNANKKSEKIKMKNPWLCVIIFIISVCVLGYAYFCVTAGVTDMQTADKILIPIALGAVSTFFIFWSLSGLLLKIFMSMKNVYYKGLNSFILRQFSSKINTTVFSMTIICLMLFFTICILSSAISIRNSMTSNLEQMAPVDIQLNKKMDLPVNSGYSEAVIEDSKISVSETLDRLGFDTDKYFKDVLEFDIYASNDILVRDTLGDYYAEVSKQFPYLAYDAAESFIKVSDYNKVAKLYGLDQIHLDSNEYVIIADFDSWIDIRNQSLEKGTPINLNGFTLTPKYDECKDGFIYMASNHINTGIFIVPDEVLEGVPRESELLVANYKANTDEERQEIEDMIVATGNSAYASNTDIEASTKLSLYEGSIGLGAMITFIGLYLGIVFLIASAAILALKELSESTDNKERFRMLRKIGTDEKMLNRALFRQIGIFFIFPLVLAVIHSIFGIKFCTYILETFGKGELVKSIIMTAGIIVFIYGGYFLITYFASKNIIKER